MHPFARFKRGHLHLTRVEAFSDGVFAIVVTLLVLELKLPPLKDHASVSELAHQLVYVAGDTEFDEAFAVTVEQVGLERWLRVRGRQQDLELYRAQRAEQTEFVALFRQGRERLARLYRLQLESQAMRQRKQILLDGLSSDIRALGRKYGGQTLYGEWLKEGLNNAHLVSVASYYDCVPGFEWLLAQQHGDLAAFYAAVRRLAGRPRAERHAQLCTGR